MFLHTDTTNKSWNGYSFRRLNSEEVVQRLKPLLSRLSLYDSLRCKIEKYGGTIDELKMITTVLTGEVVLKGDLWEHKVSLADQSGVASALIDVGCYGLHMDVRVLRNGMPVYYVCRKRNDYWAEYSLVVEDLYVSPGYRFMDERFVKLMDLGHDSYFLRLSRFREGIKEHMPGDNGQEDTDEILYKLGRHIFQAAWHEDQRPGYLCSVHFGMPYFRHAIELLYLCLSGELCELRSAIDSRMLLFFEHIYPQPAIRDFLNLLQGLDGAALNEIPKRALHCCGRLSQAFAQFLNQEAGWGHRNLPVPMHKLVFGNFSRLDLVSKELQEDESIRSAAHQLEKASQSIILEILMGSDRAYS
jgi:hypothetical protein